MAGLDSAWGSAAGRAHGPRTDSSVDLHVGDGASNLLWLQMADLAAGLAVRFDCDRWQVAGVFLWVAGHGRRSFLAG